MKITWIINGKVQLVLTPSNEREKQLLQELSQTPVDMQMFDKLQTGPDSHVDAVVITTKTN
ncbi:MAG: hypothetical protein RLZZ196_1561 [Bacteroidota bacterium]|jgi:hypothetical protein